MKEGEKITINLKVKTKGQTKSTPVRSSNAWSGDNSGGLLLPPPQSGGLKQAPQSRARGAVPQVSPVHSAAVGGDDFDFLAKQPTPQQQSKIQSPSSSALDDFLQ